PFPEWHDLRMCYRSIGWNEIHSDSFAPKDGSGANLECVRFEVVKPFERRAYGWFTEFDQNGRPIPIREPDLTRSYTSLRWDERFTSVRDRWLSLFGKAQAPPNFMDVLQVQVLVEHYGRLPQEQRDQAQNFFLQAADVI